MNENVPGLSFILIDSWIESNVKICFSSEFCSSISFWLSCDVDNWKISLVPCDLALKKIYRWVLLAMP